MKCIYPFSKEHRNTFSLQYSKRWVLAHCVHECAAFIPSLCFFVRRYPYVIWMRGVNVERERANGIECSSFGTKLLVSVAICNSLHVLNAQQHTKSRSYNIFNSVWKRVCFTCNNKNETSASARSPQNHIHRKSFTLFGGKMHIFLLFRLHVLQCVIF